jgi:hypothetical protein
MRITPQGKVIFKYICSLQGPLARGQTVKAPPFSVCARLEKAEPPPLRLLFEDYFQIILLVKRRTLR